MAKSLYKNLRAWRAFTGLPPEQRRLVFYSESGQDWHHFEPVIHELTQGHGQSLCYLSSDPEDPGLHQENPQIRPFWIGDGLVRILCFQFLRCDVMVMTMIDLNNFDLKRSINPVHYIFMFHSLISTHMADHGNSYDHYDTILCSGPHQIGEIRKRESMEGLPPKNLVEHGYHRLEQLMAQRRDPPPVEQGKVHVLLAPSWGPQTILNLFGEELVGVLLDAGFRVTLRPHYQTRWTTPEVIDRIMATHGDHPDLSLMEQMGETNSLFESHVMVTDWSGAGMDYGMGLEKPVLYLDVPPKTRNDSWQSLGIEPFESYVRGRIGAVVKPENLNGVPGEIRRLLEDPARFRREVSALRDEWVSNLGHSSQAAAEAINTQVEDAVAKAASADS